MARPEVRAKISAALKAMGHKPPVRGGNGKLSPTEEKLMVLLTGLGFSQQFVVPTRMGRKSEYPTCYKIDAANPDLMLAIEADGPGHAAYVKKAQDQKKEAFLTGLGWTVLRFTNAQINDTPTNVLMTVMSTISKLKGCTPTSQTA